VQVTKICKPIFVTFGLDRHLGALVEVDALVVLRLEPGLAVADGQVVFGSARTLAARDSGARIWGRCYDHNFRRFFPIFGEKLAFFSKTNVMIRMLHNLALF
jgi:hypothetical protein